MSRGRAMTDFPFSCPVELRYSDVDAMNHVNNAVYLNWLQQAVFEACAEVGWTWPRLLDSGVVIVQRRHEIEYFRPALRDDEIAIVSRVVGWRRVTGTWQ